MQLVLSVADLQSPLVTINKHMSVMSKKIGQVRLTPPGRLTNNLDIKEKFKTHSKNPAGSKTYSETAFEYMKPSGKQHSVCGQM